MQAAEDPHLTMSSMTECPTTTVESCLNIWFGVIKDKADLTTCFCVSEALVSMFYIHDFVWHNSYFNMCH